MKAGEKELHIVAHADGSYSARLDDGGVCGSGGSGLRWEYILKLVERIAPGVDATAAAQNPSMKGQYGGSRVAPPSEHAFSTTAEGDAHIKMMKEALKASFTAGYGPLLPAETCVAQSSEHRQSIRLECLRIAGQEPPIMISLLKRAAELERWVLEGKL